MRAVTIPSELVEAVEREAAARGQAVSDLALEMLDEALKMRRVSGIVFTDGPTGRRATVAGSGIDVWEVVATWKAGGESVEALAENYPWLRQEQLRSALDFYAAYPDEIDARLEREEHWTPDRLRWVRKRLAELRSCREMVVSDPAIRAGEPVVRGTRIPVHMLGEMAKQGASTEELLASYPALTPETLEAAFLYARLCPQRGRPRAAPWRKNPPRMVFTPEDLP